MMPPHEQWLVQARYDLETAHAMLDSGRYLYVLFCCQQAVEKSLKAAIAKRTSEFPPRLHSLLRLAEVSGLVMAEAQLEFLGMLSSYYTQTRYPEEAETDLVTQELSREVLRKTREAVLWLESVM